MGASDIAALLSAHTGWIAILLFAVVFAEVLLVIGSLTWAASYLGAGYALGVSADFSPVQAVQLSAFLLALTALATGSVLLMRMLRNRGSGDAEGTSHGS